MIAGQGPSFDLLHCLSPSSHLHQPSLCIVHASVACLNKTNESLVRANKDLKKRLEELGGKIWNGEDIPNS